MNVVVELSEPRKLSLTQGSRFGTRRAKGLKPLSMVWGGFRCFREGSLRVAGLPASLLAIHIWRLDGGNGVFYFLPGNKKRAVIAAC